MDVVFCHSHLGKKWTWSSLAAVISNGHAVIDKNLSWMMYNSNFRPYVEDDNLIFSYPFPWVHAEIIEIGTTKIN